MMLFWYARGQKKSGGQRPPLSGAGNALALVLNRFGGPFVNFLD